MERNTKKHGMINMLALLVAGVAGYATARSGNTLAGRAGILFIGIGFLVTAISWFQMRLEERERVEKLEFDELSKSATSSALFNVTDSEVFPAQRSREQFEKIFVPGFTVLICLLQMGGAILLLRWLKNLIPTPPEAWIGVAIFALLGLLLFLLGKFSTTITRIDNLRLLRPGATYLLLSAYFCWSVSLGIVLVRAGFPMADLYVAYALAGVIGFVGVETLINLILEIYRPRVKGSIQRPVYESRVVSLLGHPEGLFTTAAATFDYQFGFKVSETWFFKFLQQRILLLLLLQVVVLVLSTCIVAVEPGEQAVFERFGKNRSVGGPGLHFKLPWPFARAYVYETEQIQQFDVGFAPEPLPNVNNNVVLWTVNHAKEENFLVANRQVATALATTNSPDDSDVGKRPPPVSLLTVSIPIQFQITNLYSWVYNNEDPSTLLQDIATREVIRYFVSVDLGEIMSHGRWDAASMIRDRVQAEADKHQLGARLVFVGLQDIHPPVKVAPDYEKVVAAIHTKEAAILAARADAIKTNALAGAHAFKIVTEAQSESHTREVDAMARAAKFTNQIPAYLASPEVYRKREYLQTFARSVASARKYLLLSTNTQDVVIMNLEDKIRQDLLDSITVPTPNPSTKAQ